MMKNEKDKPRKLELKKSTLRTLDKASEAQVVGGMGSGLLCDLLTLTLPAGIPE